MGTAMTLVASTPPLGRALALTLVLGSAAAWANPAEHYAARCAVCHNTPPDDKTPAVDAVKRMNIVRVRHALTRGNMRQHVEELSRAQVEALIDHLVGDQATLIPDSAYCGQQAAIAPKIARWGYDERNTRWQRDTSIDADNVDTLRLKWAFAVPNVSQMRSQPAVSGDTVYLPTTGGELYALARDTGCIKWRYDADRPLRTAVTLGRIGDKGVLFVGDQGTSIHAIDAATGELVSIAGDVVLAGALDGRVFAFDRRDGAIRWEFATKRNFEAVNGIDGHGGAIDNPGVLAVDDLVFVTSGYGMFGQMPGNVLLVFQLDASQTASRGRAPDREPPHG